MRTQYDKLNDEVTLTMSRDEAAMLHAFLGCFNIFMITDKVKDGYKEFGDTTFIPSDFNYNHFISQYSFATTNNCKDTYYQALDNALKESANS